MQQTAERKIRSGSIKPAEKSPWVAIIFRPENLLRPKRLAGKTVDRMRVGQMFQIFDPDQETPNVINFTLFPGTNIGLYIKRDDSEDIVMPCDRRYIEAIKANRANRHFWEKKAIQIIEPIDWDISAGGEPLYRHFSESDALELIQNHYHESWVNRALEGEKRPLVERAAKQQIELILKEREIALAG